MERPLYSLDVQEALSVIKGKWRSSIIASLQLKPKRFNDLKRDLSTITPRTLVKELRYLQQHKLVLQYKDSKNPRIFLYGLTPRGHSLSPLIDQIVTWSKKGEGPK